MKQTINNSFENGMITDLSTLVTPAKAVIDAYGMELITSGADQYIFQNKKGDFKVSDFGNYNGTPFVPLAVRTFDNIAYIIAGAFDTDGTFLAGTVGTFPSPDWDLLNAGKESRLFPVFSSLHNYNTNPTTNIDYFEPFVTSLFDFEKGRFIDLELQTVYDGSINMILTDYKNPMLIINSRFKYSLNRNFVSLADRTGDKDTNTYSDDDWERIRLLQNVNFPISVDEARVTDIGQLKGGGYRYYFKYTTQEGNTSDVVYESPLIPISNGIVGLNDKQSSNHAVEFTVSNLDLSYFGLQVYFAHIKGDNAPTMKMFKILGPYKFTDTDSLTIMHTGLEEVKAVDALEISAVFTPIATAKTIASINNRLAIANVTSVSHAKDFSILRQAAESITIWEKSDTITTSYADPNTAINKLGYWKGELYEFAVVWLFTSGGYSPAFPVIGMDNYGGVQDNWTDYPDTGAPGFFDPVDNGFAKQDMVNKRGLFRFSNRGTIFEPADGDGIRHIVYPSFDTSKLDAIVGLDDLVSGYFFVRRKRKKNVILQGMAVPTLIVPANPPTVSENSRAKGIQSTYCADKRYNYKWYPNFFPTIGLNAGYAPAPSVAKDFRVGVWYKDASIKWGIGTNHRVGYLSDFDVVYIPQPTQTIGMVHTLGSALFAGNIGKAINDTETLKGPIQRLAFLSGEVEVDYAKVRSFIEGGTMSFQIKKLDSTGISPFGYYHATFKDPVKDKIAESATFDREISTAEHIRNGLLGWVGQNTRKSTLNTFTRVIPWREDKIVINLCENVTIDGDYHEINAKDSKVITMLSGTEVIADNVFTAKVDRAVGFRSSWDWIFQSKKEYYFREPATNYPGPVPPFGVSNAVQKPFDDPMEYLFPATPDTRYAGPDKIELYSSLKNNYRGDGKEDMYEAYSLITQSYSSFLGIKIEPKDPATYTEFVDFKYYPDFIREQDIDRVSGGKTLYSETAPEGKKLEFVNVGHLANIFNSQAGRWGVGDIEAMFRYESSEPYHAITKRIDMKSQSFDAFSGDGFISRFYKRMTYKNGIPSAEKATKADIGLYGLGPQRIRFKDDLKEEDLTTIELDDEGFNLHDVGQILEITTYNNINLDIRSLERKSAEETALLGGDRDFYPNKKDGIFSDMRPDSVAYNRGYTGDLHVLSYFSIKGDAPVYNTEFPNRVFLSEAYQHSRFFNSFRDFKGFNYVDYGIEYGPIIKLMNISGILISVHYAGILAIGVSDKTLISEGQDIVVHTAQILNTEPGIVSDRYGSIHPESIAATEKTIVGVDYNADSIWLLKGDDIQIISEFTVKVALQRLKEILEKGLFSGADKDVMYVSKVYSTFNHDKHTAYFSYVAEHPITKEHTFIGGLSYNTVVQKWESRLPEGNQFMFDISSEVFTTGFYDSGAGIWQEDALMDNKGEHVRCISRGFEHEHSFTIVVNTFPQAEKVLENMQLICNKSVPVQIIYETTGDINAASLHIMGAEVTEKIIVQNIMTRENSPRLNRRLSILDQNAYYKNSSLRIEVENSSFGNNQKGRKRVQDKQILIKFIYKGTDKTIIQGITSIVNII